MKFFYFLSFLTIGWVYGKPLVEVGGESPPLFWEASVEVEGEKVYLITQYTLGDGVTSLSCNKTPVPISPGGVQMINSNENWLIIANEDYYYYIRGYYGEEAEVIPLLPYREVKEQRTFSPDLRKGLSIYPPNGEEAKKTDKIKVFHVNQ